MHEFLKFSGYPMLGEAMHLVMVGNLHGMPMLLKDNLEHAYKVLESTLSLHGGK
jgi:hypothetical protein